MSDAPTPQFAPIASGGGSSPTKTSAKPSGCRPIMVRPAVSNDPVAVYEIPTAIAAPGPWPQLFGRRHGLDPRDVGTARRQAVDLLGERLERFVVGERAERGEQLAGRPDRAGDDDCAGAASATSRASSAACSVELEDAIVRVVQLQAMAVPAERVREDEVGTGVDESPVQLLDAARDGPRSTARAAPRTRDPSGSSSCPSRRPRAPPGPSPAGRRVSCARS